MHETIFLNKLFMLIKEGFWVEGVGDLQLFHRCQQSALQRTRPQIYLVRVKWNVSMTFFYVIREKHHMSIFSIYFLEMYYSINTSLVRIAALLDCCQYKCRYTLTEHFIRNTSSFLHSLSILSAPLTI